MIPRFVYGAIFLSGFASLAYELCWIRKGALLIGATPQALSVVVAVFFAGLAAGSALFGFFSKRIGNPLFCYGILECAIGLMAALTPTLFEWAGAASVVAYHPGASLGIHLLVRSAQVAVLIFPACLLMGGTLPLLCQFSISHKQADIRFAGGILYAINTGGAFLGCISCGLWLIPYLGINASIRLNAAVSFAVGAAVILLSKSVSLSAVSKSDSSIDRPLTRPVADFRLSRFIMYGVFFWAGFAALGYELLWVRFLSLIIYNTVYTCIFSLGAILLGITVGGLLVYVEKDRPAWDALLFGVANIFIGLSVLLILLQPEAAWEWVRNSRSVPLQAVLCFIVILIPSIASGISFPLAYRMVAASALHSGRDFGYLSAVSTVGGIAGSLLAGFYLLPTLGMQAALIILTCISVTIGIYVIVVFVDRIALLQRAIVACGTVALWLGIVLCSNIALPADFLAGKRTMIEYVEGLSSFVAVIRQNGIKTLEIDRMWQGQKQKGHQILAAHIPMLLHQDPKKVLVIGMGAGQTASSFLLYAIERLDCVDIEKALPGILQRHFDAAWLNDPRTHVVTDDGRNFTASVKSTYDIVSIEVGQSFRPQVASFYTVDFYRDVKRRLSGDGLACQFVPAGFFTEGEFRAVVRSFLEVFPHGTLWFNKYAELILVGGASRQPLVTAQRLALLQNDRRIHADLDYSHHDQPWLKMNQQDVFAAHFLMGAETLAKLSAKAVPYRDDRPVLEYQTARNIYLPSRFHELIEKNLDNPDAVFAQKISVAKEVTIATIREEIIHEALDGKNR